MRYPAPVLIGTGILGRYIMDGLEISLVMHTTVPIAWAVEAVNMSGEGDCEMARFTGPDAERRAREYAIWKYGARKPNVIAA